MKNLVRIGLVILVIFAFGCTKKSRVPKCGDEETKKLVVQLTWENVLYFCSQKPKNEGEAWAWGQFKELCDNAQLSVDNVSTLNQADNGTYLCQADIVLLNKASGKSVSRLAQYMSGVTDEGRHSVTSSDLQPGLFK